MVEEQNITLEEPRVLHHKETVEKRNTERVLKIFSIVLGIVALIALVWIKTINPAFPFLYVFLIGAFIVIVSLGTFFAFTIYRRFQEKPDTSKEYHGKLPKPASLASLRLEAVNALTNEHFCNHVKECINEKFYHSGKYNERIYVYHTHALYKDDMKHGEVYIIINSHYPEDLRTILIDPTPTEFNKAINHLASVQIEARDEEVEASITYNPITQAYQSVEKKSVKKEEHPKPEKKEDLE